MTIQNAHIIFGHIYNGNGETMQCRVTMRPFEDHKQLNSLSEKINVHVVDFIVQRVSYSVSNFHSSTKIGHSIRERQYLNAYTY